MSDDIIPVSMSKSEAWELTDEIRQGFESIHESRLAQVDRLAKAYEGQAWEPMGYDSFDEYKAEEFGEDLKHQRLELEDRISAVKVLTDSGMAKTEIADILGIHRNSVTNLLKRIDAQPTDDAQRCASTEVDAAGQSVEPVGLIEDDESQSPFVADDEPTVVKMSQEFYIDNKDEEPAEEVDRFAHINFDALILPTPNQIIQADPTPDTPDYFVPRSVAPSWSPPVVAPLPTAVPKAYDEPTPEFLEPPMRLEKAPTPNKPDSKHCRTCNCGLLP